VEIFDYVRAADVGAGFGDGDTGFPEDGSGGDTAGGFAWPAWVQVHIKNATTPDRQRWTGFALAVLEDAHRHHVDPAYLVPNGPNTRPDDPFWRQTPARRADHDRYLRASQKRSWHLHTTFTPGKALAGALHAIGHNPVTDALTHNPIARALGGVVKTITNNPLWKIAQTGVSFIPGLGQAVSAGMASAAALGRGESLTDIGLAAARGALPGPAQIAMDIAIGALKHQNLGELALREVREQLPGGDVAKGAFDAAIAIAHGHPPHIVDALRNTLGSEAKKAFDVAISAARNPTVPTPVAAATALAPLAGAPAHRLAVVRGALPQPGRRTRVAHVAVPTRVPNRNRAFPHLPMGANKVASMLIANPATRAATPRELASTVKVDTRDAQAAIAAFLRRFGAARELDYRDVGEFETFDQAAQRHGVMAEDLGEWPGDTAAIHVMAMPPVPLSRPHLRALYQRGDSTIKKALLAHELLAHVARNTGELEGTVWIVQGNGDWPYKVAQTVVGDGNRWKEILPLNPQLKLQSNGNIPQWVKGARIQLPPSWVPSAVPVPMATPVVPMPVSFSAPAAPVVLSSSSSGGPPFPPPSAYPAGYPSSVYTIKSGDTGEKVAQAITGDKNRWRELLVTNPNLKDPKYGIALYAGKTLKLPPTWVKPQATPQVLIQALPAPAPAATPAPPVLGTTPATLPAVAPGGTWMPATGTFGAPVSPPALEPVAVPAPAPLTTASSPVVTGSAEQIGAVQIMLAAFYRDHHDAAWSSPEGVFGATPNDLAGVWDERTTSAFLGFERWWNGKGKSPKLVADGLPDADAVAALIQQSMADGAPMGTAAQIGLTVSGQAQRPAAVPTKKAGGGGDMIIPLGLLLAALGS
jgi:hypothetical protein